MLNLHLAQRVTHALTALGTKFNLSTTDKEKEQSVLEKLEQVVEGTDPKIRLIRGYRQKLFYAVKTALEYTELLVDRMPGAIDLNAKNFVSDPYVNAFFASSRDLRSICNQSSELKEYFEESADYRTTQSCVLLCMQKTEKTTLGMELSGDQVRKEVKQTTVSFSDHKIYAPAATEPEARQELKHCIFEGLINKALTDIVELRADRLHLETERRMLASRLRRLAAMDKATKDSAADALKNQLEAQKVREKLNAVEDKLRQLNINSPQASLDYVKSVFKRPYEFIELNNVPIKIDRMGVKINDDSVNKGQTLNLSEVNIGGQNRRIVTLARLDRNNIDDDVLGPALHA